MTFTIEELRLLRSILIMRLIEKQTIEAVNRNYANVSRVSIEALETKVQRMLLQAGDAI